MAAGSAQASPQPPCSLRVFQLAAHPGVVLGCLSREWVSGAADPGRERSAQALHAAPRPQQCCRRKVETVGVEGFTRGIAAGRRQDAALRNRGGGPALRPGGRTCLRVSAAARLVCLTWWGTEAAFTPGCSCLLSEAGKGRRRLRAMV